MRFSEAELALVKKLFEGEAGEATLKLLRKVFLPEFDPRAPLGQSFDLWVTMDITSMHPEQAYQHILARNQVITHVENMLLQLQILAGLKTETKEQVAERNKKDSTK